MQSTLIRTMLLTLVCAVTLTGCKKEDTASSGGPTSRASGDALQVVYIAKNTGNPYFDDFVTGAKKAAGELGANFEMIAPASADATSQIPLIQAQVQAGVDVLIISPNSPDAVVASLKDAQAKGVTVICADSDVTGNEGARDGAVLAVDPKDVGYSQIELIGKQIGYKGKIAILTATTDSPNQNVWIGYMKEALKDPKYKDMELVGIVYGDDQPQKSTTEAEALLTKYPDLRGIIAPTTVGVAAAAKVVETQKKADQVKVIGLGLPNQMRSFVKSGSVEGFSLWSPAEEGYVATYLGVLIDGDKIEAKPGTKFTAGEKGEREIGQKNTVIAGKPIVFDKSNIDQYNF